jgi:hypothetical protein
MGHQKVTTVVSKEENVAAHQFAREGTGGLPVYRTIGESTELDQTGWSLISHQETCEAHQKQVCNYAESKPQQLPKIEENLTKKDKEETCNMKPGDSAKVSWDASQAQVVTTEKQDQRSNGAMNRTNLMDAPRTASHFMGHQKVLSVVSNEETGAAQQFASEGTESIWTGTGQHHQTWWQQEQRITSRTENGAVPERKIQGNLRQNKEKIRG